MRTRRQARTSARTHEHSQAERAHGVTIAATIAASALDREPFEQLHSNGSARHEHSTAAATSPAIVAERLAHIAKRKHCKRGNGKAT